MVGDFLEVANGQWPLGMFNRAIIRRLLLQHRLGEADDSSAIWLLLKNTAWI
jgi:hypothetical protein